MRLGAEPSLTLQKGAECSRGAQHRTQTVLGKVSRRDAARPWGLISLLNPLSAFYPSYISRPRVRTDTLPAFNAGTFSFLPT